MRTTRTRRKNQIDLDSLWIEYKTHPTKELRDKLVVNYVPLVNYIASKVGATLPKNIDKDDLVSYGIFGLFDSIEKFDLDRGFKFETYAMTRIRGAILDELRSADWVPRSVRFYKKTSDEIRDNLRDSLNREPTEREVVDAMGVTEAQERAMNVKMAVSQPFEPLMTMDLDSQDSLDTLLAHEEDLETSLETEQLHTRVSDIIIDLPDRERIVMTLCYYDGLTLGEIGKILGVTESRVCQIHTRAIGKVLTNLD